MKIGLPEKNLFPLVLFRPSGAIHSKATADFFKIIAPKYL